MCFLTYFFLNFQALSICIYLMIVHVCILQPMADHKTWHIRFTNQSNAVQLHQLLPFEIGKSHFSSSIMSYLKSGGSPVREWLLLNCKADSSNSCGIYSSRPKIPDPLTDLLILSFVLRTKRSFSVCGEIC